ncbi:MAG TPA: hypothetical protein VM511_00105, partial [Luteolibacter sp.]|nr:hypothetical protein [Luteolibacter sp.]
MSIRREHFIWLIPIVVGAAAYWRAEAMHRIGDRAEIAGRSTGGVRGTERRFRNAAELDVELKRLRSEAHERQQRALDQVPLMGLEELKEELLSLDARIKQAEIAGDFEKGSKLRGRWFSVVDELGAKGGEAEAVWLLANCSQAMKDFIDAWAEAKPEEALHYIERSNLPGICETRTVMKMLDRLAKADPKKLKSAVGRVPWDLLVFEEGDPFEGAGM